MIQSDTEKNHKSSVKDGNYIFKYIKVWNYT